MNTMVDEKIIKGEFGAGTYFIGDICYALHEDLYLNNWLNEHNGDNGCFQKYAVGRVGQGDGVYKDIHTGKRFSVDAGNIGVVDMKYKSDKFEKLNELGLLIDVNEKLTFSYDVETAKFYITWDNNEIEIHTNPYTIYYANGEIYQSKNDVPDDVNEYKQIETWNDWTTFNNKFEQSKNKGNSDYSALSDASIEDGLYRDFYIFNRGN